MSPYLSTVVYEGCPKAFDAGIWWPKTKFGRPAAMNCPKGSIGKCGVIRLMTTAVWGQTRGAAKTVWDSGVKAIFVT